MKELAQESLLVAVVFLLLGWRLVGVVGGSHDGGGCWRPQSGKLLGVFAVGGDSLLSGALWDVGGAVAQHEQLLVDLVLQHLYVLYGGRVDDGLLDVVGRHLEGRRAGAAEGCDVIGVAGGLEPGVVLDVLPAVGGYVVEDLLGVALVCWLALSWSCLDGLDLLLLGEG